MFIRPTQCKVSGIYHVTVFVFCGEEKFWINGVEVFYHVVYAGDNSTADD
jgi:hypothetical protein